MVYLMFNNPTSHKELTHHLDGYTEHEVPIDNTHYLIDGVSIAAIKTTETEVNKRLPMSFAIITEEDFQSCLNYLK